MEPVVYENLNILWNYMRLGQHVEPAECIIGFGCINDDIAVHCAKLYLDRYAPKILFTGGLGRNTLGRWSKSEAERFADIAIAHGVPADAILLEDKSTNSAENILFTREILEAEGLSHARLICVHKPFMERRLMAAMGVYWPEINAVYTSPQLSIQGYIDSCVRQGLSEHSAICVIVGDFQRMEIYAQKGYQIPQYIPPHIWDAFHILTERGYTDELVLL